MEDRKFIDTLIKAYLSNAQNPYQATLDNTFANRLNDIVDKLEKQEKENELLKKIIKSFFDKGCPLHQYTDKDLGLTIEVDSECSNITLGEFKGVDLNKKLEEVLNNEQDNT